MFSKENLPLYLLLQNKLPKLDISISSVKIHAINNREKSKLQQKPEQHPYYPVIP